MAKAILPEIPLQSHGALKIQSKGNGCFIFCGSSLEVNIAKSVGGSFGNIFFSSLLMFENTYRSHLHNRLAQSSLMVIPAVKKKCTDYLLEQINHAQSCGPALLRRLIDNIKEKMALERINEE